MDKKMELAGKKILVVEDNETNAQLLEAFLEEWGCENFRAVNGLEAITMAQSNVFDAIFMDIHMPGMTGIAAVRKIREFSKVPIIAITASMLTSDLRAAMGAGVNDYVLKPVKSAHLFDVLKKNL
jgi:CheY-like chemotaxis protein